MNATSALQQMQSALALTAAMASQSDTQELLNDGLQLAAQVLECERGMIIVQTQEGSYRIARHTKDPADPVPFSKSALSLAAGKREPLLVSDTLGDETLGTQVSIQSHNIRSILCTILDTGDTTSPAFLYLDSRSDRTPFTHDHLAVFGQLASLLSVLLRRSRTLESRDAAIEALKAQLAQKHIDDLVFGSDTFRKTLTLIHQAAPTTVPVLLVGETGTGKEVLARTVHKLSLRSSGPFLAVNCGALPPSLIESQLFGHCKGAFTGAVSDHKGYFEEAHEGTLFLDEIGELPLDMQTRLLRVLQEGEITRVGTSKVVKVSVRIISATNVNLDEAVAQGRFRSDLLFRINVITVPVPPVRSRADDSLLLARTFLERYCKDFAKEPLQFSRDGEKAILHYGWPGNIREIQNKVQRAVITAHGRLLDAADLGLETSTPAGRTLAQARESVDRELIADALRRSPGNLTGAGKILDIDRKSLRLLLEKYKIDER